MGGGSYSRDAYEAITSTRTELPREQVFTQRGMNPEMDPRGVAYRESRDSPAHPESNAIIFAKDQTSSMGDIPEYMSKVGMPEFVGYLYDGNLLPDPQLMVMAYGDARNRENAPLQVGQFESEAELIDKWLVAEWLEAKGGGNGGESAELPLFFADRHTSIDCFEKRGRKGYLFFFTDDNCFPSLRKVDVKNYLGEDIDADIPTEDLVASCSEKYHIFCVIPDEARARGCEASWRNLLGDRVIVLSQREDAAAACAVLIGLTEGTIAGLEGVSAKLQEFGLERRQLERVRRAVEPYAAVIGAGGESRPVEDVDADDDGAPAPASPSAGKKGGKKGKKPGRV